MEERAKRIIKWIGISIVALIVLVVAAGRRESRNISPRCLETGCNAKALSGSYYCGIHQKSMFRSDYSPWNRYKSAAAAAGSADSSGAGSGSVSNASSGTGNRNTSAASSGTNRKSSSEGNNANRTLNNDPDDFMSAEDYADEAWGEDFDDWDEAYDYWEEHS